MGAVELVQRFVEKSGSAAGERRNDMRSTTSQALDGIVSIGSCIAMAEGESLMIMSLKMSTVC